MPTSYPFFKQEVKQFILENIPISCSILDLGAGCGTYSDMLKKYGYFMEGVEIFKPYIDQYDLKNKYHRLHNVNLLDYESYNYHRLVIMGDVLEHLSVEDAKAIIAKYLGKMSNLLVAVPFLMEQGEYEGNTYETHLQADLTPQVMNERYPELELLYGNEFYGYYINKDFWYDDKAFVLSTDQAYFDLAKKCIESIRLHSDIPIILYTINDNEEDGWATGLWDLNVNVINWVAPEVHSFTERKDFIDRSDLDVYKLLIQRPKIMLDALKYAKVVAYVDADSIATKYATKMFDFYHDQPYPLFVHGVYDYLMINGRGGASDPNDLSGTLEAPICDLYNINQYTRQNYRQTGYFVCGQKTKAFLREWAWMTEHPEILKNPAYFVPFNEETVVNALLWKLNITESLPYCYINGLHKSLEFKGQPYFIADWQKIPAIEELLWFYHGEKDIDKINEFIEYLKL